MKISKNSAKIFFCSLAGTLLTITLLCGFIVVEKNTRYIAFGDDSPFFVCEHEDFFPSFIKVHFMGKDYIFTRNKS